MRRKILYGTLLVFVILNLVAYQHAYKFTHFDKEAIQRTRDPKELSAIEKAEILFIGIENPRPNQKRIPDTKFKTINISSTVSLECWLLDRENSKGTVVMFHGYAGEKTSLLDRADEFLELGYKILLVDFMGSGGSEGKSTTIGYKEAEQVKDCFGYLVNEGEENIILFGTSMGAAAILKAMDDYSLNAAAIILECPFGSLYETVKARFTLMNVPTFPMAGLLCFWGGVQNGYWAFSHNPIEYAKSVLCPTLLLYGALDNRVSLRETELIFDNLNGEKILKIYPSNGHDVFSENEMKWVEDVSNFLIR